MSYQVFWIVKYRVLYTSQTGDVTLEDLGNASREIADLVAAAYVTRPNSPIIGVVDVREANLGLVMRSVLSNTIKEITNVIDSRVWKAKPGFVILVTASESVKLITSIVIRLSTQPMTTVATFDEALNVIGNMYPDLREHLETYKDGDPIAGTKK